MVMRHCDEIEIIAERNMPFLYLTYSLFEIFDGDYIIRDRIALFYVSYFSYMIS